MAEHQRESQLTVVHLTASPFLGGPERQLLGLARSLPDTLQSRFWSFSEGGKCQPFLEAARGLGFEADELVNNTPNYRAAIAEVSEKLIRVNADLLLCHGYKADILGGLAARRVNVPVVAVSRGWTGVSLKVRLNEALDRLGLIPMDRVVCVSEGQAVKVRRAGIPARKIQVIRNAIFTNRFDDPDSSRRRMLIDMFPTPPRKIVGAAGRLSPEKGFDVLVEAAVMVVKQEPEVGFIVFGDGPLRETLSNRIEAEGLGNRFLLVAFCNDLDRYLPHLDLLVIPSYTEGLPNVALEASAASVAVVATDVGGIPEVVEDGVTGYLVPAGDPASMATRIVEVLGNEDLRQAMGEKGRNRVETLFTFEAQAKTYLRLFREILMENRSSRGPLDSSLDFLKTATN